MRLNNVFHTFRLGPKLEQNARLVLFVLVVISLAACSKVASAFRDTPCASTTVVVDGPEPFESLQNYVADRYRIFIHKVLRIGEGSACLTKLRFSPDGFLIGVSIVKDGNTIDSRNISYHNTPIEWGERRSSFAGFEKWLYESNFYKPRPPKFVNEPADSLAQFCDSQTAAGATIPYPLTGTQTSVRPAIAEAIVNTAPIIHVSSLDAGDYCGLDCRGLSVVNARKPIYSYWPPYMIDSLKHYRSVEANDIAAAHMPIENRPYLTKRAWGDGFTGERLADARLSRANSLFLTPKEVRALAGVQYVSHRSLEFSLGPHAVYVSQITLRRWPDPKIIDQSFGIGAVLYARNPFFYETMGSRQTITCNKFVKDE
jgi:hypothetical protein